MNNGIFSKLFPDGEYFIYYDSANNMSYKLLVSRFARLKFELEWPLCCGLRS